MAVIVFVTEDGGLACLRSDDAAGVVIGFRWIEELKKAPTVGPCPPRSAFEPG